MPEATFRRSRAEVPWPDCGGARCRTRSKPRVEQPGAKRCAGPGSPDTFRPRGSQPEPYRPETAARATARGCASDRGAVPVPCDSTRRRLPLPRPGARWSATRSGRRNQYNEITTQARTAAKPISGRRSWNGAIRQATTAAKSRAAPMLMRISERVLEDSSSVRLFTICSIFMASLSSGWFLQIAPGSFGAGRSDIAFLLEKTAGQDILDAVNFHSDIRRARVRLSPRWRPCPCLPNEKS